MDISINPLYLCNYRCDTCYLTLDQLKSKQVLDPIDLATKLAELIVAGQCIEQVDLYGGELALLSDETFADYIRVIESFSKNKINLITNFSIVKQYMLDTKFNLAVSFDFTLRQDYKKIIKNIEQCGREVAILVLYSDRLAQTGITPQVFVDTFNSIDNVTSVEIKPYSKNQANDYDLSMPEYEQFIIDIIEIENKQFTFGNKQCINTALESKRNAFSDDHLFITPSGEFAVLCFDNNNREYFQTVAGYNEFIKWTEAEKQMINNNIFCSKCEYLGRCLTEHYTPVDSITDSCTGNKKLLDYFND